MRTPTIHEAFLEAEQAYHSPDGWMAARIEPGVLIFCHPEVNPPQFDGVQWTDAESFLPYNHGAITVKSHGAPLKFSAKALHEAFLGAGYNHTTGIADFMTRVRDTAGMLYYISGTQLKRSIEIGDNEIGFEAIIPLRDLFNQPYKQE